MPELIIRPEMLSHIEILRQQPQVLSTDPVLLLPLRSRFDDVVGHPCQSLPLIYCWVRRAIREKVIHLVRFGQLVFLSNILGPSSIKHK